jgi:hypothetical protein
VTRLAFTVAVLVLLGAACTSDAPPATPAATATEAPATLEAAVTAETPMPPPPAATPTVLPAIRYHPESTRTGVEVVDAVIAEILEGDGDALSARVRMATAPCRDLVIYLFECGEGVPEGTPVHRFNSSSCNILGIESIELARERVRAAVPTALLIHSVSRREVSADQPASYWIYFGVLTEDDQRAAATFWLASDGGLVGVHHCGFPASGGSSEFLLPPVE